MWECNRRAKTEYFQFKPTSSMRMSLVTYKRFQFVFLLSTFRYVLLMSGILFPELVFFMLIYFPWVFCQHPFPWQRTKTIISESASG